LAIKKNEIEAAKRARISKKIARRVSIAERATAAVVNGVARDSKGMGPSNPEPSGSRVPCPLQCTAMEKPLLDQRLQAAGVSHDVIQCNGSKEC
jgi:hypothetical protein